jgi:hypothetical protein
MKYGTNAWDEVRKMADEIRVQVHLASMDVRDRWRALEPKVEQLGKSLETTTERAGTVITEQVTKVEESLKQLLHDMNRKRASS